MLFGAPAGQFRMLIEADSVYRLLGVEGLRVKTQPTKPGSLTHGRLGWHVRREKGHFLTRDDWERFLDFADAQLGPALYNRRTR